MISPLVSVILPVYNREDVVREAINSILEQTLIDFELLIIDDASTDRTLCKVKEFTDKRIKILKNKKNRGVSASRNLGFEAAAGRYIALMDSDDIALPQRFQKQVEVLDSNPEVGICGSLIMEMDTGRVVHFEETHPEIILSALQKSPFANPTVILRKEVIFANRYNEELRTGEDYDLWSRIIWKTKTYNVQEPLLLYRNHLDQLSKKLWKDQREIDAEIQLSLFRKIPYSIHLFPDEVIKKILLFQTYFSLKELNIFLKWLEFLNRENWNIQVFPQVGFQKVVENIRMNLLFQLYFGNQKIGIDKYWRIKALYLLSSGEITMILRSKLKEYVKRLQV